MEYLEKNVLNTHISVLTMLLTISVIIIGVETGMIVGLTKRYIDSVETPAVAKEVVTYMVPVASYNEIDDLEAEPETHEAYFTNYYVNDATGSTNRTGSGKKTSDFMVNENGWYTYDGKVVLAGATYEGLKSNYGVLANYTEEIDGIIYHSYGDIITININGEDYEAIILDTCGACMVKQQSDNDTQRYDVMIAGKQHAFGKVKGVVYE